ncbi:hypothetical protein BJ875DRAFT_458489 [Amylocarpus encephaloides]|uniref:Rhodopsin domain-containing protein n=1 Tax=Amylocarpus encephaloides TaxID=45428 RepID=A0A9P7YLC7_9HELO|nr:hypothetical protein BJ875DRAFT_458489 [Amylocarpus encephaloides]
MSGNGILVGMMPVPAGETPDFNIYHLSQTQIAFILAYIITLALAVFSLSLRLYTRIAITESFGLDDALLLLAMAASISFFAVCVYGFRDGFGKHMWEVTATQVAGYTRVLIGMVTTYIWAPAFTKLSFLVLMHRLNPQRWFRFSIYTLSFGILTYTIVILMIILIPCSPLKPNTNQCLNSCGLWQAVLNIVTDFLSVAIPIPMIVSLKLPTKQKIALFGIFSTGLATTAMCIVRIQYIMGLQNNPDVTYTQPRAAIWSCVELNLGIFCTSVVVLKPFIKQYMPRLLSFSGRTSENSNSRSNAQSLSARIKLSNFMKKNKSNSFHLNSIDGGLDKNAPRINNNKNAIMVTSSVDIDTRGRHYAKSQAESDDSTERIIGVSGGYELQK